LALTTADTFASDGWWPEDAFDLVLLGVALGAIAVNGWVIYAASQRQHWARIVLLAITALVLGATFLWPIEIDEHGWLSFLLMTVATLADVAAMIYLFSPKANRWYKGPQHESAL
jgi:hypothetical protein